MRSSEYFDALALVGFRSAKLADVSGALADSLLVDTLDDHLVRIRQFELDTSGGSTVMVWE